MSLDAQKLQQIKRLDGILDSVIKNIGQRGTAPKLPTTLSAIDDCLWGVHKKEVLVIGARPGEGKSAISGEIGWNLANANKRVAFLSLEMSTEQMVERLLSNVMEINNVELRKGVVTEEIKYKMESFKKVVKQVPLLITDNIGYSIEEVEDLIQRLDPPIDVLILDYIQLCRLGKFSKRLDAITEYMRGMKEMSVKYNFAAIVCSQINRVATDRKNKRPMLQDLKGSGSIEETADAVMLLYWPYNNEQGVDPERFEILVEKQRHGPIGHVEVNFTPQYYKFSDRDITYKIPDKTPNPVNTSWENR